MAENPVSGPHDESAVAPSVDGFIDADHHNLDVVRRHRPEFRELIPRLNAVYDLAGKLIPQASDPTYGRALFLCNKALLSAAANIGRGHPEEAGAITRRAIEIATTAVAIKHDPDNRARWIAKEKREARREARRTGTRAPRVNLGIKWPPNHPLLESLRTEMGMLSDIDIHFTPEYMARQHWHHETKEKTTTISLPYHCPDERVIRRQLILLAGFHLKMLGLLDECYDQAFSKDAAWREAHREADGVRNSLGKAFLEEKKSTQEGFGGGSQHG